MSNTHISAVRLIMVIVPRTFGWVWLAGNVRFFSLILRRLLKDLVVQTRRTIVYKTPQRTQHLPYHNWNRASIPSVRCSEISTTVAEADGCKKQCNTSPIVLVHVRSLGYLVSFREGHSCDRNKFLSESYSLTFWKRSTFVVPPVHRND